jgi:hypothetical protein
MRTGPNVSEPNNEEQLAEEDEDESYKSQEKDSYNDVFLNKNLPLKDRYEGLCDHLDLEYAQLKSLERQVRAVRTTHSFAWFVNSGLAATVYRLASSEAAIEDDFDDMEIEVFPPLPPQKLRIFLQAYTSTFRNRLLFSDMSQNLYKDTLAILWYILRVSPSTQLGFESLRTERALKMYYEQIGNLEEEILENREQAGPYGIWANVTTSMLPQDIRRYYKTYPLGASKAMGLPMLFKVESYERVQTIFEDCADLAKVFSIVSRARE